MIGSDKETMAGFAAGLSATEDRELLTRLNVDSTFQATPTFEMSSEGQLSPTNSAAMFASLHSFEPNLLGFDDALDPRGDGFDETYFSWDDPILVAVREAGGVPWPTPWTDPSDWDISSTRDWDGNASSSQTSMSGFEGGVFADALKGLEVAPQIAGKNVRRDQLKAVAVAAFQPGTQFHASVVKKLLDKSVKLGELADKRALVTQRARNEFEANLRRIHANDAEISRLVNLTFDAQGKLKLTATDAGLKRLLALRKSNIALGRDTVRLQKLNLLATAITGNTLTQITALQNLAHAVATGTPQAVPALGLAYDKLGRENAKIKAMRATQLENWHNSDLVKKARNSAGLEGFDGLYGRDVVERPFDLMEHGLSAIEFGGWFKKAFKKFKHAVKKAGHTVANVAKEVEKTTVHLVQAEVIAPAKGTIEAAKRIAHGDVKGAFKAIGGSVVAQAKGLKDFAATTVLKWGCDIANTHAFKAGVSAVGQAVGEVVGGIYGQPTVGGAIGNEAGGQAANTQRNTCGALKTVGLTDGTFRPGRIKSAASSFAKRAWNETLSPKAQLRSLKNIAMNALGGQFTSSFHIGGVDVMKKIGLDPEKLVSSNPAIQNLYRRGVGKLQGKLQSGFQKGAGSLLAKTGVPYAQGLVSLVQSGKLSMPDYKMLVAQGEKLAQREGGKLLAKSGVPGAANFVNLARGGRISIPDIRTLTAQGENLARREAASLGRRATGRAVMRAVPGLLAQGAARVSGNVSAAELHRIAASIAPATVSRSVPPSRAISKYISQPTEEALPYVGSIGRDY